MLLNAILKLRQDRRDAAGRAPRQAIAATEGRAGGDADDRSRRGCCDDDAAGHVRSPGPATPRATAGWSGTVAPCPRAAPRPDGGYFDDVVDRLAAVLGGEFEDAVFQRVTVHRDQR